MKHGTTTGYRRGCRGDCCRKAQMVAVKRYRLGQANRIVPSTGTHRRIQGLLALGYTHADLGRVLGASRNYTFRLLEHDRIRSDIAARIADLYDRLCMTPAHGPLATRSRNAALRKGYVPPLMWDCIDTDPAPATVTKLAHTPKTDVDEAVVLRVMAGERLPMTTGERVEVVARLRARGWSLNEIETRCHIGKPERYLDRGAA